MARMCPLDGDDYTSSTTRRKVSRSQAKLVPVPTAWLCGEEVFAFNNSPWQGHVFP